MLSWIGANFITPQDFNLFWHSASGVWAGPQIPLQGHTSQPCGAFYSICITTQNIYL